MRKPVLLPVERTDFLIRLPANIVLTGEGESVFSQSGSLLKNVKKFDGRPGKGLQSPSFNAQTVQKLIINSFVEEIYVSMPDLLRARNMIMDTTKLATFGILYKKMNPSLAKMLLESSVLQDYNRKNPKNQINDLRNIDSAKKDLLLKVKKDEIDLMELEIRNEVIQMILGDKELEEEDRLLRMRSLDKFIAFIDGRIWYLYYVVYQTPLKFDILRAFARMVFQYLDRTKIATYLATMLMELIQNAERAHFERLLIRNHWAADSPGVDKFLKKKENREKAIKLAVEQRQFLNIAWKFARDNTQGRPYRIEIIVSNHGMISKTLETSLAHKMKTDTEGLSMAQFFEESGDDKLGAGLGLLYLSYLEDECRANGLNFNCQIYPEPEKELTVVNIQITF